VTSVTDTDRRARPPRSPRWWLALGAAAVLAFGVVFALRSPQHGAWQRALGLGAPQATTGARYASPDACAACHRRIASTYSQTGMARSFAKVRVGTPQFGDVNTASELFHAASGRHYTMETRDGQFVQRRHTIGFDGRPANTIEFSADYVIGSGNHARTFLHRDADGRLREMPVSWYADRGGYWAMSPGYDRRAHLDFRRVIPADCMACHNGYPRGAVTDEGNGPAFAEPLPEGIDCQRCHGPGQAHIDAAEADDRAAARRAIVNPARLDRDRQIETCLQCHLETTSSPLPFQIRRYERAPFSYVPGNPLGDYAIHFDHAAGSGREDKFEIVGSASYRLRQSACFLQSEMTCVTCHNPHDIPRGEAAVQRYVAVCESCHAGPHKGTVPALAAGAAGPSATCLDCHMPKRRAEDAVHVVMTDHLIQRHRPAGDLRAPRAEAENFENGAYRGEVVPYYPATLPSAPDTDLYLALAQVQQGSNLEAGIGRLQQAIEKHQPERPEFYYELGRAHAKRSNYEAAIRWSEEALRRDGSFAPALKELADAAVKTGDLARAVEALARVVALQPKDVSALGSLGNVHLQQGRAAEARTALQRALALDPHLPEANNTMGLAALAGGETAAAEQFFRAAIRAQPDLAEAHNNLGNLLAGRRAYEEASHHFAEAIRHAPEYVDAHHSHGVVLAATGAYPEALAALRTAVRLAPERAPVRTDLAAVLAAMGRAGDAAREYELAIEADPREYDAHLALGDLRARAGRIAEARRHFEAAAGSADPDVRQAARAALGQLPPAR
jgi:tetratricopeptide (TPR) repeat protein